MVAHVVVGGVRVQRMSQLMRNHENFIYARIGVAIATPDIAFLTWDAVQIGREGTFIRCPKQRTGSTIKVQLIKAEAAKVCSSSKCRGCAMKPQCTPSTERRVRRWEHEAILVFSTRAAATLKGLTLGLIA